METNNERAEVVLMAWLERQGFTPISRTMGSGDGYFTANVKDAGPYGSVGKILYHGTSHPRKLRAVSDRLTALGIPWTAEQNAYHFWMLIVPLCGALFAEQAAAQAQE